MSMTLHFFFSLLIQKKIVVSQFKTIVRPVLKGLEFFSNKGNIIIIEHKNISLTLEF